MSVLEHPSFDNHEKVLFATDEKTGLKAIIGVHSTARGPACGGCRFWTYDSSADALDDALRLSQGMSYKNVMADLPIGGGKSVIMKPQGSFDRDALFQAFGRAVDALNGNYITAEDVGVSPDDMVSVYKATRHVTGLPEGKAASGDPSPVTAEGVFRGIRACVKRATGSDDMTGIRVAVQGAAGHVGTYLCGHLSRAGAEIIVADMNVDALQKHVKEFGATIVDKDAIYDQEVDVFAPCALGSIINPDTIDRLKVRMVAGAANNQLATREMGAELQRRGILYAPDYVINAGGIINVTGEIRGDYDPAWVKQKLVNLEATLGEILDRAENEGRPSNVIADEMARARIEEAAASKAAAA
ncbi:Glu/Leu/Phe/Val dehydrogenase dimerization domain-containing protein [Hyphobacterium sp. HN65]|uniref:Glu/Leu/Phe/Val dehydrogenase dimerization domain-containing protein n=1 Tax=Hyphobacterium lacteum TaxID=3116575 RepID=A0ABU7LT44_9PROT|nr:Glu/Leu/Phe/Val dehydrogenase dimerization domain-containing protein [Hyphobacterium sp. HN65]MEE2527087.1 Glu/Leu/Phe/Val dehydrogenase dimerization domain-containing protein [Hyphobacterium sp. HN65]